MKIDKSTVIALLGIGAVAIYALTRQQKTIDMGEFPDTWSGGSATPGIIINFPELPPPSIEQPPDGVFQPPLPPDYNGGTGTHKKDIGPTGGFGGGGAGGR